MNRDDGPRAIVPTEVIPSGRGAILSPEHTFSGATREAVSVVDTDLATFDPEAAKTKLQNYRTFVDWLTEFALGKTEPRHWVDYAETGEGSGEGGQPWLTAHGAEMVAGVAAIACGYLGDPMMESGDDEKGAWYLLKVKMWFRAGPRYVETTGSAFSRDKFLSRAGRLSAADVDRNKIYRKADSRCKRNGYCEILGIRGMTWDDVERITGGKVTAEKVKSAKFKKGKEGGSVSNGDSGDKAEPKQVGRVLDRWAKLHKKDREKNFNEFGDWVKGVMAWDTYRKWNTYTLEDVRKLHAELDIIEAGER